MRMLAAVLVSLGLLACSDSTSPDPIPDRLTITGGNFQEARVTERLPDPLVVEARMGTQSVSGVLVCWVSVTEGAGAPFLPCAQTDETGGAGTPWDLGILAGDHVVEARAVMDGEPVAVATYELRANPGPPAFVQHTLRTLEVPAGDTVDIMDRIRGMQDEYGNEIPLAEVAETVAWARYHQDQWGNSIPDPEGPVHRNTFVPVPEDWCETHPSGQNGFGWCGALGVMIWAQDVYIGGFLFDVMERQ